MKPVFATLAVAFAAAAVAALPPRPADDVARDAARKPMDMVKFAGLKPGMTVGDYIPGGGYFTRVFAEAVGPKGKVVAFVPPAAEEHYVKETATLRSLAALPGSQIAVDANFADPALTGKLDVAFTAQNYHDIQAGKGPEATAGFNKVVFAALKPGGRYIVIDHVAAAGSGYGVTNQIHRIDPALVKADVVKAGFVFDGESKVLANAADDHAKNVFDPAIRGKTDQFAYRFRKP